MESGFFVSVLSFLLEGVFFLSSLVYLIFGKKQTASKEMTNRIWALVGTLSVLGALSSIFSYRYAAVELMGFPGNGFSWVFLFSTAISLPFVLFVISLLLKPNKASKSKGQAQNELH